jgi:hypothetical protein
MDSKDGRWQKKDGLVHGTPLLACYYICLDHPFPVVEGKMLLFYLVVLLSSPSNLYSPKNNSIG